MEIRRGWPLMWNEKRAELESVLEILNSLMSFDMAILYGQYAGGEMRSRKGGYELLLVTRPKPQYEGWELEKRLGSLYKYEIREDTRFHIETASIHRINQLSTSRSKRPLFTVSISSAPRVGFLQISATKGD